MADGRAYEADLEEIAHEGIYDQVAFRLPEGALPGGAIAWVTGSINGRAFEANTSPAEDGRHWVFVPADLREEIGVRAGERVQVVIDPPDERPEVPAPDDFREALAQAGAGLDFEQLTARQRHDYVDWVAGGEGSDRAERIRRAVEGILARRPPHEVMR